MATDLITRRNEPVRRQATHLHLCVTDGVFSRDPHGTLRDLAATHGAIGSAGVVQRVRLMANCGEWPLRVETV